MVSSHPPWTVRSQLVNREGFERPAPVQSEVVGKPYARSRGLKSGFWPALRDERSRLARCASLPRRPGPPDEHGSRVVEVGADRERTPSRDRRGVGQMPWRDPTGESRRTPRWSPGRARGRGDGGPSRCRRPRAPSSAKCASGSRVRIGRGGRIERQRAPEGGQRLLVRIGRRRTARRHGSTCLPSPYHASGLSGIFCTSSCMDFAACFDAGRLRAKRAVAPAQSILRPPMPVSVLARSQTAVQPRRGGASPMPREGECGIELQ